jgi:thiol-disulfide isomerase/thioredoxin
MAKKRSEAQRQRPRAAGSRGSSTGWALITVGAVVAIAAVMFIVFLNKSDEDNTDNGSAASIAKLTSVPASILEQIGVPSDLARPLKLPADVPPIAKGGKPVVTYIGAEYCPFCAMERWPMVIALSRFGTFSNLTVTASSAEDVFPNTPTVTFHGSSYTSDYIVFSPVEIQTRTGEALDPMTPQQQRLFSTYDRQQYTGGNDGAIPFAMIGNLYAWAGTTYDPTVLDTLTFDEIANRLTDPSNKVAQAIDGTANQITAMICQLTDNQPQKVCSAAYIQQAQALLQGQ